MKASLRNDFRVFKTLTPNGESRWEIKLGGSTGYCITTCRSEEKAKEQLKQIMDTYLTKENVGDLAEPQRVVLANALWAKHGFKVEPSIYYYLDDGLGSKFFLEYNYQYDEKSQFRINYSIRGSESFSGIRWKHGFYKLKQIDSTTASVLGLQVEGERNGKNGFLTEKYTLSYRYRFNALQKWLFFEIEPFLEFPKDENYSTTPGIALHIEGFFSKK